MSGKSVAVRTRQNKKPFGVGEPWTMVRDGELAGIAASDRQPKEDRILAMAQMRVNAYGHASFEPGELRRLLDVSRQTIFNGLEMLKTRARIAPESTTQCIVLPATYVRRTTAAALFDLCTETRHKSADLRDRMWLSPISMASLKGWEPYRGAWDQMLEEAPTGADAMTAMAGYFAGPVTVVNNIVNVAGDVNGNIQQAAPVMVQEPANTECVRPSCTELAARPALFCAEHLAEWELANEQAVARSLAATSPRCSRDGCDDAVSGMGLCYRHQVEEEAPPSRRQDDERVPNGRILARRDRAA